MNDKPRLVPSNPPRRQQETDVRAERPADFSDPASQAVLDATARAVALELGRQYAREVWNEALAR